MGDLTDFLLARIAEDEADASSPNAEAIGEDGHPDGYYKWVSPDTGAYGIGIKRLRLVAECEAKREALIFAKAVQADVERLAGTTNWTVTIQRTIERNMARVYAEHPDYREEWKP